MLLLGHMVLDDPVSRTAYAQAADPAVEYAENGTGPVAAFSARDQDGDAIGWALSGPDADLFAIAAGVLRFRAPPDYEDPQSAARGAQPAERNVYRVTVEASGGTHDIAVTVTDVDEAGMAGMDRPQPQVDRPLEASLFDEDGGVTDERWQWSRSEDRRNWTDMEGARSPVRIPVPADVGMYLRATVTYSDGFGTGKTASAVSAQRVEAWPRFNAAPSFVEPDDGAFIVVRSVPENRAVGATIGRRVSATDADNDILFYELLDTPDLEDEAGRARFTIDSLSGQLRAGRELGADPGEIEDEDSTALAGDPALPPDEDADDAGNSEYVLRVRASDPSTASTTVNVIVRVREVNEATHFVDEDPPTVLRVRENEDPPVITLENGSAVDADTYAVTDQDRRDTTFSYSVSGDDSDALVFEDGVLSFEEGHEVDFEAQSSYSITVVGRSRAGSRRLSATLEVIIEVVDAEEDGEVFLSQREPQVGSVVYATVSDPEGGVAIRRWEWERSEEITVDDNGTPSAYCRDDPGTPGTVVVSGWTRIDGVSTPTYTPTLADVDRCLRATAVYRDAMGDSEDRAMEAAEAPVQSRKAANAAPKFVDQDLTSTGAQTDRTSRRVVENTESGQSIGLPVSAFDEDDELLIYTLGGADAQVFGISRNDGQLRTKAPLNYEARRIYTVMVIATDPSGASTGIQVTINVTDVDDPARITGVSSADYAENGTGPVATFTAYDESGHAIDWSLSGRDDGLFTIGGGVLRFRAPPDYEDPRSAARGAQPAERNVYRVTVEAHGGTHDVAVTVTDVDEAGTASMDRPQPQVGRPLEASLFDEDEGVTDERWQWARSEDGRTWTDLEGATSLVRSPVPADVGMYLRATVAYSDGFGTGKMASAVSAHRVEARPLFNAAPSFVEPDDGAFIVVRSVPENRAVGAAIGRPVSATDADDDILFYELLDTPDLEDEAGRARFTIDSLSGQLRAGRELGADPGEIEDEDSTALAGNPALPQDEDADEAGNSEYVLRVRVSDPSTASRTVNVIVRVTEVNEAPHFDEEAPTVLRVRENEDPPVITLEDGSAVDADTYEVTDQDGVVTGPDGYDDTYSVSGADHNVLEFDIQGVLRFRTGHEPDYEDQNSYSITVVARSGEGARSKTATLDVTIEVVDTEDDAEVILSQRQPQVGIPVHVTAIDDDGGVTFRRWVWERSDEITVDDNGTPSHECMDDPDTPGIGTVGGWKQVGRVRSAVYTPQPADVGRCLRARAVYADNIGDADDEVTVALEVPVRGNSPDSGFVNAAPVFPDQDFLTEGDQSDRTSRTVAENTEAGRSIGARVRARDDDGDLLIYTLGGADAAVFSISRNSGQLKTKGALDYESKNVYTVVVTVTDPFGAADSIEVTIDVTDVDDPAVIRLLHK